jgi:hypothetical protein
MMNPLYPQAVENSRMRRSVGSSRVSSATLGLSPIHVHSFGAKRDSQVCLSKYRYLRSGLKTESFRIAKPFTVPAAAGQKNPPRRSSGPEGCDENGPAAVRCRRSALALHSREEAKLGRFAYAALPAAHFDRNKVHAISGTGH